MSVHIKTAQIPATKCMCFDNVFEGKSSENRAH